MNDFNHTTIELIGGNQTFAMCVAPTNRKWISACDADNSICFRFGRNKTKANWVTFRYVPGLDLYTVVFEKATFGRWTITQKEVVQQFDGVYGSDLRGLFERVTGLNTSLTRVYA